METPLLQLMWSWHPMLLAVPRCPLQDHNLGGHILKWHVLPWGSLDILSELADVTQDARRSAFSVTADNKGETLQGQQRRKLKGLARCWSRAGGAISDWQGWPGCYSSSWNRAVFLSVTLGQSPCPHHVASHHRWALLRLDMGLDSNFSKTVCSHANAWSSERCLRSPYNLHNAFFFKSTRLVPIYLYLTAQHGLGAYVRIVTGSAHKMMFPFLSQRPWVTMPGWGRDWQIWKPFSQKEDNPVVWLVYWELQLWKRAIRRFR